MKAKTVLVAAGVLLLAAGIVLVDMAGSQAWAVGIAIAAMVVTIFAGAVSAALTHGDRWVLVLTAAEIVGVVLVLNGGVGALILFALAGCVVWEMTLAAVLAGLGAVLLGVGWAQE